MDEQGYENQPAELELDDYLPAADAVKPAPATPARPMPLPPPPPPRRGKGWQRLWKVTAWALCLLLVVGSTGMSVAYVFGVYGGFTSWVSVAIVAGVGLLSLALGLFWVAGVMVRCAAASDMAALRRTGERRRQNGQEP